MVGERDRKHRLAPDVEGAVKAFTRALELGVPVLDEGQLKATLEDGVVPEGEG